MCFKKKKNVDKVKEDRELVAFNSKSIETLLVHAEKNQDLTNELKELQNKLNYLIPSIKSEILDYDKKIKNKIGDMKIALTKSDGETSNKAEDILKDIKIAIAERNARL